MKTYNGNGNGRSRKGRSVVITGGAGFVGTNVADRFARDGYHVIVFDNLSRAGVERNARWLRETHGERVRLVVGDVRDEEAVRNVVTQASHVFHFAAQVAVTTSLIQPIEDFDINLRGTVNVLEAIRALPEHERPPLLFTSTNKVYGDLHGLVLEETPERYRPTHQGVRTSGFAEGWLDFHSPYGCSKGAADQYVLDYARSYGMKNIVFRMSCIYGPHQCGNEDQGWVAHFLIRTMQGEPISVYGDGKQVRDVLFVQDLVEAMRLAMIDHVDRAAAHAFNMGGGPGNAVSLVEMLRLIGDIHGEQPELRFGDWRRGDQKYYVSDTGKFSSLTGWQPRVSVRDGVAMLYRWLDENVRSAPPRRAMAGNPSVAEAEAAA